MAPSPLPPLLVITGPPGAGKSTVAQLVAWRLNPSVLVEGDAFFGFLATGAIEPWLPESARQNEIVTDAAASAAGRFIDAGYATVYDGVLGPWLIDRFLTAANLDLVDYAILLPSVEQCVVRVSKRVGHGFTDEGATRKMHHEFSTASIDRRHLLRNDSDSPLQTAEQILALVATGALRYQPADGDNQR